VLLEEAVELGAGLCKLEAEVEVGTAGWGADSWEDDRGKNLRDSIFGEAVEVHKVETLLFTVD